MPILCYHSIDEDWESPLAMRPRGFAQQCEWLSHNRTALDLETAASRMDRRGRLPRKSVAITLDDGFADNYEQALPLLLQYRLPATVFVVAETVRHGQEVDWVDDAPAAGLRTLTRDQVLELHEAGITIGSHSLHHRVLPDLTDEECLRDLRESKEILEDLLRKPVRHLAYPRGRHNAAVRKAAAAAGYAWSFALPQSVEPVTPHSLPRVGIFRDNGPLKFRAKLWESYLQLRTLPVYRRLSRR